MTKKQNKPYSNDVQKYDDIEYAVYCDSLEKQYKKTQKQGMFEILKILDLDEEHSDSHLVQAINHFKTKEGIIEKDAPIDFLTEREKLIVNKDNKFRPDLYCMLLSVKFSDGIQSKSVFLQGSFKYAFNSQNS